LPALCVRALVWLRPREPRHTMTVMEARALIEALGGERARFVRMARGRMETTADAEDVVQRAMMRAAERSASLADPARVRAWFYRILRRTIVDHHRSASRNRSLEPVEIGEICDSCEPTASVACGCAARLLGELRPAYAEVLRRVDLEGEDPAAVAARLGISSTNFYVRLHRARKALRERLEQHCGVSSVSPCLDCTCSGQERCGPR
jgi:DNA-directed RNA polymerase specialized sigma24 family protein